jgi:hypothetical protein
MLIKQGYNKRYLLSLTYTQPVSPNKWLSDETVWLVFECVFTINLEPQDIASSSLRSTNLFSDIRELPVSRR